MDLQNLTITEIIDEVFHWYSYNSTHALAGLYELKQDDSAWVLTTALVIFTMQTGFVLIETGVLQEKNKVNVLVKNIVDVCAGGLGYWAFGFALMYGRGQLTNPFFGFGDFFVNVKCDDPLSKQVFSLFFFEISFATSAISIASGTCAERFRFSAYILFAFLSITIYGVGAGWVWGEHGWLRNLGVLDFSGAGPVHITGGTSGLIAAWYLGPRIGRYDKGTAALPMSNPVYVLLGLFVLWWSWLGFNTGSAYGLADSKWEAAARAGAGTIVATMAAGMTSIIFSLIKHKGKVDVYGVTAGIVSSLVAINSGCYMFSTYCSAITGSVAALLCLSLGPLIEKVRIDDASGNTAVHLVNGIWGQISVGLFADPNGGLKGLFIGGGTYQLTVQVISAVSLMLWSAFATIVIIWFVDCLIPVRMDPEDEIKGCDVTDLFLPNGTELAVGRKSITALDRIISTIATPIARRFSGTIDERLNREYDNFGRRKVFHDNEAFRHRDSIKF